MDLHPWKLELRLLARERGAWIALLLFACALAYGASNGVPLAREQDELARSLREGNAQFEHQLRTALERGPLDSREVASQGSAAFLPPAPLPLLATGQADLEPGFDFVNLWRLATPAADPTGLENPAHLLAGRFDLAFVLVWLLPLCLLALLFDLLAGERESGTLRMALAQGVVPARWLARRALARALPALVLAALATWLAGSVGPGDAGRLALAIAVVLAYGLFWTALAAAVNAVARTGAGAAMGLGAAWVVLVLVLPTLLNVVVETLHPTPSQPERIAAARHAAGEAEQLGGELMRSFYRDHPELAPATLQADLAAQMLAVQDEVARAVDPVQQRYEQQLERQQADVGRWRFLSPAIAAHEAFTDLAGTGFWRQRAYRAQLDAFKDELQAFYAPRIHRRERLRQEDFIRVPRFAFVEEPGTAWALRVGVGCLGVMLLSGALALFTARRLRSAAHAL